MRSEREEQLFQLLEEREFLPIAQVSELLHITPATARRLANRLAEAFSQEVFEQMKTSWWGFRQGGIRPACG